MTAPVDTGAHGDRSREDLSFFAREQAALRRVATLVARESSSTEIFRIVTEEARRVLETEAVGMLRFGPDASATLVAQSETPWEPPPLGARFTLDGENLIAEVFRTGRPARDDDWARASGAVAAMAHVLGVRSCVATPIVVEGRLWGTMIAATSQSGALPGDTESRIGEFTALVATAIANAQARVEIERLADEQAALRRVAELVARKASQTEVFSAIADAIGGLLGEELRMVRYEDDAALVVAGSEGAHSHVLPVGARIPLGGNNVISRVFRTGEPARMDDYSEATGPIADAVRSSDPRSVVATPIIVAGRRWGAMLVGTFGEQPVPADCEGRLGEFTELMATAIANADARAELIASRARIVTAGDEARRRIERNLHDGTQQRLIALGLDLQHVRMLLPPDEVDAIESLERAQRDVESILEDVRELSRGLHPATLSRGGLQLALRALVLKSPIPVQLTIDQRERPPASIETAAYYVVSEALANAIRYSHGSEIGITIEVEDRDLCASVVDDGVGGASPTPGSGLAGLIDRVDALGGRFDLDSPIGRGTRISIAIPLEGPLSRRMELAGLKPATSWAR